MLYTTTEPKVVRNYVIALLLGDIGHLAVTFYIMEYEHFVDVSKWNALAWGNIAATVCLLDRGQLRSRASLKNLDIRLFYLSLEWRTLLVYLDRIRNLLLHLNIRSCNSLPDFEIDLIENNRFGSRRSKCVEAFSRLTILRNQSSQSSSTVASIFRVAAYLST